MGKPITDVIVINENATWVVRKNPRLPQLIEREFSNQAHIIRSERLVDTIDGLTKYARELQQGFGICIHRLFVVGGDSTVMSVKPWVLEHQPKDKPIGIVPVGGGQMNLVCKEIGFRTTNPLINLREAFNNGLQFKPIEWRPIEIWNSVSGETRLTNFVSDGVVERVIRLEYDPLGKGSNLVVGFKLIPRLIWLFFWSNLLTLLRMRWEIKPRKWERVFSMTQAVVRIDGGVISANHHFGFLACPGKTISAGFKLFNGEIGIDQFRMIIYSGHPLLLITAVPFFWIGWIAPWIRKWTYNKPARTLEIELPITHRDSRRVILDGDSVPLWPYNNGDQPEKATIRVTRSESIVTLLAPDYSSYQG
ncbi:MAG: hypothetical protein ABIH21_00375 [Patescibacteria group bacterium]